jgi:hypothetical protein
MQRAEEITAPIKRDELLGLLNTMTPAQHRPGVFRVTLRTSVGVPIEIMREPAADLVAIHSEPCPELGHSMKIKVSVVPAEPEPLRKLFASFAAAFVVGLLAISLVQSLL